MKKSDFSTNTSEAASGAFQTFMLDEQLTQGLQALSNDYQVPLFHTLLNAFQVLVARYGTEEDISVSTPSPGRPPIDLSGNPTFADLLTQMQDKPAAHLFETMFANLKLSLHAQGDRCAGTLAYNTDRYEHAMIERMISSWQTLLAGIVADPQQRVRELPLLTEQERHQLLVEWNETSDPYPLELCVHQLFEQQVERTPEAIAVGMGEQAMTYRELNERANQVAHYLRKQGVGADGLVGVCMQRSLELIVGILGTLKAGGAYVPIDPTYPAERISRLVTDSQVRVVLTTKKDRKHLPKHRAILALDTKWKTISQESHDNPLHETTPEHLAYVNYTSGSTGQPKGVCIPHRAVVRLVKGTNYVEFSRDDVFLQFGSVSFDATTFEIWGSLLNGARLVLFPGQFASIYELGRVIREQQVTTLFLTAGLFHQMGECWEDFQGVRYLIAGGDVLSPAHVKKMVQRLPHCQFINGYGPTENTTFSTYYPVRADHDFERSIPIGRPIAQSECYVLDASLQPVPVGVVGELHVGGAGLARGYLNQPELTRDKFIPNPFAGTAGERLYKTGDMVRWLPDGNLEFIGRVDNQVKIRGYRIELEEIQVVIAQYPAVREVAVVVREDVPGDKRVVAYLVLEEQEMTLQELREELRRKLPAFMMPSSFEQMDILPLTTTGKVDRKALPLPKSSLRQADYAAPGTETEQLLASIWSDVLRLTQVGIHDDFFDLGGHSLLATQVISRLKTLLHVELPLQALFDASTIAELAGIVERMTAESGGQVLAIQPVSREGALLPSFAQQRLWVLDRLHPETAVYNLPYALRLLGTLDRAALEKSLNAILVRHEALRTTFAESEGQILQVVAPPQWQTLPALERPGLSEEALTEILQADAQQPFDLERGPLIRFQLIQVSAQEHVFLYNMHHIVSDGWSMGVFAQELTQLYSAFVEGREAALPALPVQYADVAQWQREWLQGDVLERQLAYWKRQLSGELPVLQLPLDHPRPPVQTFRGATCTFVLDEQLTQQLKALSQHHGVTLYMALLGAFQVLLARYSGQEDISVGTPIAGRTRQETEGLIGFFVNTLVMRTDLSGGPTFAELLKRVRDVTLGAYAHQDVPFEKLVEELQPERDRSRSLLFQVMFVLQNAPVSEMELPGVHLSPMDVSSGTAKFDLTLTLQEADHGLVGTMEYNTDLFEQATIERMNGHFLNLLQAVVLDPQQPIAAVPILSAAEYSQLVTEWNETAVDLAQPDTLPAWFEQQAALTPDAVAVADGEMQMTYAELNERANQLAHHLQRRGVRPDVLVGVCMDRSLELVIALLAISKAGGAYVPIDPSYPQERIAYMVEDANVPILLTESGRSEWFAASSAALIGLDRDWPAISEESKANPQRELRPEHLCYVIYTSGSTGRPKGTMIEHRGVVNYLQYAIKTYGPHAGTGAPLHSSIAFDLSVTSVFVPLLSGRCVQLLPELAGVEALGHALAQAGDFSLVKLTPAHLQLLSQQVPPAQAAGSTHAFVIGGENLTAESLAFWQEHAPQVQLYNEYGPTEAVVGCVVYRVPADEELQGSVPIGRPIDNMQIYVLDASRQPVPIGVTGEIYIGGVGVARGYLNRPELTAERFVPNPFAPEGSGTLYRTGDLARYRSDGVLEYLGRCDEQVKLRGYRIEPGEIESALAQHPAIHEAVVLLHGQQAAEQKLVAYIVPTADQSLQGADVREYLTATLPEYMVPAAFVTLAALPLTGNGKVDRRALPAPDAQDLLETSAYTAPRTPVEEIIAGIYADVLGLVRVGVTDNFFARGGHSLLAIRATSRLNAAFSMQLPFHTLFESPTVEALAKQIDIWQQGAHQMQRPPLQPAARDGHPGLSFAQQRLWLIDQLLPGTSLYNTPFAVRLQGDLRVEWLARSLDEIVARHEVLRTTFVELEGEVVQVIADPQPAALDVLDLRHLSEAETEREVRRLIQAEADHPFDLRVGPLLRARLLQVTTDESILLLNLHHIVSDGWSMDVLSGELAALYTALAKEEPTTLAPLSVQYADYAAWERQWLTGDVLADQLSYWKKQLGGELPVLQLSTDHPRPPVQTHRGALLSFELNQAVREQLQALSQQHGTTLFMTLLSAFNVLLARYSSQEDIIVGTPIAGRSQQETEGLIGFFVNTLVLRTDLSGEPSFAELLGRVRQVALDAYAHQDVPFERLVEELQAERDMSRSPLFQVMFEMNSSTPMQLELPGLTVTPVEVERTIAKFDLTLSFEEQADILRGEIEYNTDLFEQTTIERMIGHFQMLLTGILQDPAQPVSKLPILTAAESHMMLVEWNDTQVDFRDEICLHHLFEEQAERTPDWVAAVYEGQELTYRQLEARANQLAAHLQTLGVGPNVPVGVCVERSLDLVVALVGVLKAGGAFVPMDTEAPTDRILQIIEEAQTPVCLSQSHLRPNLPADACRWVCLDSDWPQIAQQPVTRPVSNVQPEDLVSIYYTSGSTGKPKGVASHHRGWVNRMIWNQRAHQLQPRETVLQKTTLTFDDSAVEFYWPLMVGGRIALIPPGLHRDPLEILRAAIRYDVVLIQFVPSVLRLFLEQITPDAEAQLTRLRSITSSGEPLRPDLVALFMDRLPGRRLYNLCGATEVSIDSTVHLCSEDDLKGEIVCIGKPFDNNTAYILDKHHQPVPIGAVGDLYYGGIGLAQGYWRNPEQTARAFMPNPFEPGTRMYKSGDLAYFRADGSIQFLGRNDDQVKVRGVRIELGEVEVVLGQHPAVRNNVVVAHEFVPGDKRLIAYVQPRELPGPDISEYRTYMKEKLPEYMVPSVFILIDKVPLTPNGKVDRRALPLPESDWLVREGEYTAPRTATEQTLADLFGELLGLSQVSVDDNFFGIGGHSLLATQVVSRIRQTFAIELPLRELFEQPTVAELAARVEEHVQQPPKQEAPRITAAERAAHMPLSFAQQRLWLVEQMVPGTALYNMPAAFRITDALDKRVLVQSLNEMVKRHDVLRTTFIEADGTPMQVIAEYRWQPLTIIDLQAMPAAEREQEWPQYLEAEANRPFDLRTGPLCRFTLLQLDEQDHVLLLNMHHIVSDGWSTGVFLRELTGLYQAFSTGQPSPLLPLPIQYADYAVWQRQWLQGDVLEQQLSYWKQQLGGELPVLQLPTDRPRPPVQTHRGETLTFVIDSDVRQRLQELSHQQGATLFMVLLAAYQLLLSRYSGQDDILVGTPIAGRNHKETEDLIGFFVNTLVMRTNLAGAPDFLELLARVREAALGAYSHQDLPFEKLVEELQCERDMSRTPLFQAMFVLLNESLEEVAWPGLTMREVQAGSQVAKFDLTLSVVDQQDELAGYVEYNTDLFDRSTMERMIGHFQTLLQQIANTPERSITDLELLGEQERQHLLDASNNTDVVMRDACTIHERFCQLAAAHPEKIAVSDAGQTLTYRQLHERSNQLAHLLRARGVQTHQLVALLLGRDADVITAMLAVLKIGAAYVPIDPDYPEERIRYMLSDSDAAMVLTSRQVSAAVPGTDQNMLYLEEIDEAAPRHDLPVTNTPDDLAYVIYTSGSTGLPKGTQLAHRGVLNLAQWKHDQYGYGEQDVVLQFASYSFDASVAEIFSALLNGAHLHILTGSQRQSAEEFAQAVAHSQATICELPTVFFKLLSTYLPDEDLDKLRSLRTVFVAGEALPPAVVRSWQRRMGLGVLIVNAYGPTETTVCATAYKIETLVSDEQMSIPIGTPMANTKLYILDAGGQLCPVNVAGELYIESIGLARGYLNQPDKTSSAFLPHPFAAEEGKRIYRTGDLARWRPDGTIEYLGRRDTQIKVRGHRIEIGELEELLMQHEAVEVATVVPQPDVDGNTLLHAYYTAHRTVRPDELRSFVAQKLPAYMLPAGFRQVESMPLSPSGKVDRKALMALKAQPKQEVRTPVNSLQQEILAIWSRILERDDISVHDNFFDIGGHSLLLAKVRDALKRDLHLDVPFVDLFKHPTVKSLTDALARPEGTAEQTADRPFERERAERGSVEQGEGIAIIGMALRFPEADTPAAYWRNLRAGRLSVREFPESELVNAPDDPELRKEIVRAIGLLDDADQFDPDFFQISEREAKLMNPQHRIFLECAWEAFEDAGLNIDTCDAVVSVYAGAGSNDYLPSGIQIPNFSRAELFQASLSSQAKFLASRVSYKLNLTGESLFIDTACSTSLVAVHMACQSLLAGHSDYALAGGVSIQMPQKEGYVYEPSFIMSPDGQCRAFDQDANGTAVGSGAGVVVLKRLSEAVRDGDAIYAVIKGSAINNDGNFKVGYTAPSQRGQAEVIARAQAAAAVRPEEITFVEAHGTGTHLGDQIEVAALKEVFGTSSERPYCALGSVKTNLGHLDAAAGIASLIKATLALYHGEIPPTVHFQAPNPELGLEQSPFYINNTVQPWTHGGTPRRAGVSSFGIGGTNAHVILEEAPVDELTVE